jgi:predicted nucleotidyltransferase
MRDRFSNSVEVRFIDRDVVIRDLRQAVAEAKAAHPEIVKVLLFGSFVEGNWTADSDADLFVVVQKEFADIFDRTSYAIFAKGIPVDSIVYSETEFDNLSQDPSSFLAQNLPNALELYR